MRQTRLRRPLCLLAALLGLVLPALVAVPASAAAAPDLFYEVITVPTTVDRPLGGKASLRVEIYRDRSLDAAKMPIIMSYSPYNTLAEPEPARDSLATRYVPRGYARVVADVLGTRGATGCWDYGGLDEQTSGKELVNALAALPWSNGRIAMHGVSYNGTTANMVAALGDEVPALKAIVPIAAISRWYGYAYFDGVRYTGNTRTPTDEGLDTPLAFDYGFGRTVSTEGDPAKFADLARARTVECTGREDVTHTQQGYTPNPDYTSFWQERDYLKDASKFRAAVLLVHGWQDYNVKQDEGTELFKAIPLDNPATPAAVEGVPFKRMYMSQATHANGVDPLYLPLLDRFFDKTLKGIDNGVDRDAYPVLTRGRTVAGPSSAYAGELTWPPAGTTPTDLHLHRVFENAPPLPPPGTGETGTLETTPQSDGPFTYIDNPALTEEAALRDPLNEPGHGYYSLYYQSAPLTSNLRIAGSALLDGWFKTSAPGMHLTPLLVEVKPDGSLSLVERGFLHTSYRGGRQIAAPVTGWFQATTRLLPQDYTFTKGNRVGLIVKSFNTTWGIAGAAGVVNMSHGPVAGVAGSYGTKLVLPVAPVGDEFAQPVIPEVPFAALVPLAGVAVLAGAYAIRRRRYGSQPLEG